jgi:hypothetical protein
MANMKYVLFLVTSHEYLFHITFSFYCYCGSNMAGWLAAHVQDEHFVHIKYQFLHHGTKLNVLLCLMVFSITCDYVMLNGR